MIQVTAQANATLQAQQNQQAQGGEFRGPSRFQRHNPPTFNGSYDPEGAQICLQEIEKIFSRFWLIQMLSSLCSVLTCCMRRLSIGGIILVRG